MANTQHFGGDFTSQLHQLNGNIFHAPVSIMAPGPRDRGNTTPVGMDIRPKPTARNRGGPDGAHESSWTEGLTWNDCIQSLAFAGATHREAVIERPTEGTCEWLFKTATYSRWINEQGLLLIRGKPGCGKSTLLKFALERQQKVAASDESLVMSFFFYASGTELQNGISGLLRSLLIQLCEQDTDSQLAFQEICQTRWIAEGNQNNTLLWHQAELQAIFERLMSEVLARRKTFIFVDAVDECRDQDRDRFISLFHNLKYKTSKVLNRPRICFTCRLHPDGQIDADFRIRPEEESQQDIRNFIEQELRLSDESESSVNDLKKILIEKSEGLFLWLVLVIRRVHEMSSRGLSLKSIKSEILECPRELNGLYTDLLYKIEESELPEAIKLFQWICFSRRPLSLHELRIAMTVHLSGTKSLLRDYEDEDNPAYITNELKMRKKLIHLSKGLADVSTSKSADGNGVVGFYHETVKNFMLTEGFMYLNRMKSPSLTETAHFEIMKTCLDYLSTEEICIAFSEGGMGMQANFFFLDYAATKWLRHGVEAEKLGCGGNIRWPDQNFLDKWVQICKNMSITSKPYAKEGTTLMHVAAEHGLERLVKVMCANPNPEPSARAGTRSKVSYTMNIKTRNIAKNISSKNISTADARHNILHSSRRTTPTVFTSERRLSESLRITAEEPNLPDDSRTKKNTEIMILTSIKNKYGESPLHLAACSGHLNIIRILQKYSTEINTTDNYGYSPLFLASMNGHINVVKFLLEKEADIHAAAKNDWTSLTAASSNGHLEVVKLLLKKGAYIRAANNSWISLSAASSHGHLEVVNLLLESGADINAAAASEGWVPLSMASNNGHVEVVKLLLERGANIHAAANNGWTSFHLASGKGHFKVVTLLLEKGADIHAAVNHGSTSLSLASENGHLKVVKLLLERGADINSADTDGRTSLNAASSNGHLDVVKLLLDNGADINAASSYGWTSFAAASDSGHTEVIKLLLERGADIAAETDDGWTPLIAASNRGHIEVVKLLLKNNININAAANDSWTSLIAASSSGHVEIVKLLLENGADIHATTNYGWTSLNAASFSGHLKVVKLLLEGGADIHAATNDGWTSINLASKSGHLSVVKLLLDKGADIDAATNDGRTSLNTASNSGHLEVVRFLIEKGAHIDAAANSGWTSLNAASNSGHLEVVKLLLDRGADVHAATNDGWAPLNSASDSGHLKIVELLLERGADINVATNDGWTSLNAASDSGHLQVVKLLFLQPGVDIHITTSDGWTSLHLASIKGHIEIVELLIENSADIHAAKHNGWTSLNAASNSGHLEVVKLLLKKGADIHAATNKSWTPLFAASNNGYPEVVKVLLDGGADVNAATNDGWTPLDAASNSGHLEVVKLLLERGADIHTATNTGWTSLHSASSSGHLEVVKILSDSGADINAAANDGWTSLIAASNNSHIEVVRLLLESGADVHAATNKGWTPLHMASSNGNIEIVELMLSRYKSTTTSSGQPQSTTEMLNRRDMCNRTPLHLAFYRSHPRMVKLLLDNDADISLLDCYGRCAADWALILNLNSVLGGCFHGEVHTTLPQEQVDVLSCTVQSICRMNMDSTSSMFIEELGRCLIYLHDLPSALKAFEQSIILNDGIMEHEVSCDACTDDQKKGNIRGQRLVCKTCPDTDLCTSCFAMPENRLSKGRCLGHEFLQVPATSNLSAFTTGGPMARMSNAERDQWLRDLMTKYPSTSVNTSES